MKAPKSGSSSEVTISEPDCPPGEKGSEKSEERGEVRVDGVKSLMVSRDRIRNKREIKTWQREGRRGSWPAMA